jgi:hypothetical protein
MIPARSALNESCVVLAATYVACRQMNRDSAPSAGKSGAPAARPRRAHSPLLGIAWRLGLGLAAVAAVLVAGEVTATRTTREALEAVRRMQREHEPLAARADAVLEKLVAYDRAVGAYVRSGSDLGVITRAGDALERAVAAYFANRPQALNEATLSLRAQLSSHI